MSGFFIAAVRAARKRLPHGSDAGREEFEKAEALRKGGKFAEAGEAYQAVVKHAPEEISTTSS
jgi:hypothetical protein